MFYYLACGKAYHAFAKHKLTIEKLEVLNKDNIPTHARVEALTDIADAFRCTGKHEDLLLKATEALELCRQLDQDDNKTKKIKSELIGRFGWYYHGIQNHSESLKYFMEQLSIVLDTDDETPERIGWAYYNVGLSKKCLNEYGEAVGYFEKALNQFQSIKMDFAIANTYRAISGCHDANGDYEKALERLSQSLTMFENLVGQEHNDTAVTKQRMAMLYRKIGNIEKAIELHNQAVEIIEKLGCSNMAKWWIEEFSN